MSDPVDDILRRAADRAKEQGVPYAGLVTPPEAHALATAGAATLVDVRSRLEADYVGRVPGVPIVEWKAMGAAQPNLRCVQELEALPGRQERLLLMCRSGARSHVAAIAAADAGHPAVYNVLEGFEGDLDDAQHRGTLGGWRKHGLPWVQS